MPIAPVPRFRSPTPPDANCAPLMGSVDVTTAMEVTNCPAMAVEEPSLPPAWADCSRVRSVCAMAGATARTNDPANEQNSLSFVSSGWLAIEALRPPT
jgi:hypothetical protein